jgi:hypothetical protein
MDEQLYEQLSYYESHLNDPECSSKFKEELTKMTKTERSEYVRRRKLDNELAKPRENKYRGVKSQNGKLVMFEYENLSRDFDVKTIFLAMENYIFDRYRSMTDLDNAEKSSINKFLNRLFNHSESGHVDTIYDVFVKPHLRERDDAINSGGSNTQLNPAFIPEAKTVKYSTFAEIPNRISADIVVCNFLDADISTSDHVDISAGCDSDDECAFEGTNQLEILMDKYSNLIAPITRDELCNLAGQERWFIHHKGKLTPMPAYAQLRNAANFHLNKLEEHRSLAKIVFNARPKNESLIHTHGVFDNIELVNQYRVKESANIYGKVIVVPVGYSNLADDFKCNRESVIMYNPSDPELEIMLNGKHNIRRAEARAMKKRSMSKLNKRTTKQSMDMIRDYSRAKDRLATKGEREIHQKYSGNEEIDNIRTVENAESALDSKINNALQFLDNDEVVFNTLKAKKGKLTKGDDIVVKL